jgi:hypothetical protein
MKVAPHRSSRHVIWRCDAGEDGTMATTPGWPVMNADLKDFKGPCFTPGDSPGTGESNWNDCVSSVRTAPGWKATLFGDDDYRGSQLEVTADVPDLKFVPGRCGSGMDDCVTSIRVSRVQ